MKHNLKSLFLKLVLQQFGEVSVRDGTCRGHDFDRCVT